MAGLLASLVALVTAALTAAPAADVIPPSTQPGSWQCATNGATPNAEQTAAVLEHARELVTEITVALGDGDTDELTRGLSRQLRSIGITPAVATDWQQAVHDLATTLLDASSSDPRALDVAVRLASAGFSPTPADLRAAPGPPSAPGSDPAAQTDQSDQVVPGDAASCTWTSSGGNEAQERRQDPTADTWERHAAQVATTLASEQDPEAQEISSTLAEAGFPTSSDNSRTDDSRRDEGRSDGGRSDEGRTDKGRGEGTFGGREVVGSSAWRQLAIQLARELAAADGSDPGIRALAQALADAGFTGDPPVRGGTDHVDPLIELLPVDGVRTFTADFETGDLSEWGQCQAAGVNEACAELGRGNESMQVVQDQQRGKVASFSVTPGDTAEMGGERSEVSENDPGVMVHDGDERWYQWSMQFPPDFENPTGDWFIVMQWHPGADDGTSPPLSVQANNDGEVELVDGATGQRQLVGPVRPGEWVDYTLHAKFSQSDGFVEAWENGRQTVPKTPWASMTSDENYLKMGIYRDDDVSDPPVAVRFDDIAVWAADRGTSNEKDIDEPATDRDERGTGWGSGTSSSTAAATWEQLAECESNGGWGMDTGVGYSGGLQFDRATWKAYGGGEFAPTAGQASREQQITVAERVVDDRGDYGSWPACAKKLGLPRE